MAQQFNAIIATQNVHFRGVSTIAITNLPNFKSISGSVYSLVTTGGVSGTYACYIVGHVAGQTYAIAGITTITNIGTFILYPATYSANGSANQFNTSTSATTKQIDQTVPPSHVVFQGNIATAGISISAVVGACIVVD